MTLTRGIPLAVHGAMEVIAAPVVMVAPFVLGFDAATAAIAIAFGAVLMATGLQVENPERVISISALAAFDYLFAATAATAGISIGIATGEWAQTIFLVGLGAAQAALTAATRFSAPAVPRRSAHLT
jgi:hypothetical protein